MSKLIRYNNMATTFDSLVNEIHNAFWRDPIFQIDRNWRPSGVSEDEKSYTVEIELPRVKRENITVEAVDGGIVVEAKTSNRDRPF